MDDYRNLIGVQKLAESTLPFLKKRKGYAWTILDFVDSSKRKYVFSAKLTRAVGHAIGKMFMSYSKFLTNHDTRRITLN